MGSLGYHKRVPRRKFQVKPNNRQKRIEWCRERLHWTYKEWSRVIFSDESFFSTIGFHHRPMVIRNSQEVGHPDCIDERDQSGHQGIPVWEAFCGALRSGLIFVPQRATVDSATYTALILELHLIPFWHETCEAYGWTKVDKPHIYPLTSITNTL